MLFNLFNLYQSSWCLPLKPTTSPHCHWSSARCKPWEGRRRRKREKKKKKSGKTVVRRRANSIQYGREPTGMWLCAFSKNINTYRNRTTEPDHATHHCPLEHWTSSVLLLLLYYFVLFTTLYPSLSPPAILPKDVPRIVTRQNRSLSSLLSSNPLICPDISLSGG